MPLGFGVCVFFFQDLHVFVSLYIHICQSVWVCVSVFSHMPEFASTCTFATVSECLHVFVHDLYMNGWICLCLCAYLFGFLYEDAITCICMSLEINDSNETSDISQMPGKPKVKSDAGEWLGRPSAQIPLAQQLFSSTMKSAAPSKGPFWLPLAHLDLQGPLSVHF